MKQKYSNLFWHQGVKVFEERLLKTAGGKIRIDHLENDVTKSLLNVFQHGDKKILGRFLKMIGNHQSPDSFEFDFQVTDSKTYRHKKERIMLAIVSSSTKTHQNPDYGVDKGIPDACIFNNDTAVLIEVKTQSPLVPEQIASHIKQFLGSATRKRTITWEEISEAFSEEIKTAGKFDRFLLSQFVEFLDLIGIAEFNGFRESDFMQLGEIIRMTREDYLDFKRVFHRKIAKFMSLLDEQVQPFFQFKKLAYQVGKVDSGAPVIWSAFYFIDSDKTHVNHYPNVNFNYWEHGIELSVNAETQPSVRKVISAMKTDPVQFERFIQQAKEFNVSLYYKLQFLPQNHLIWNLVTGYPVNVTEFSTELLISAMDNLIENWQDYKKTLIYQMEKRMLKHPSGRFYSDNEIEFAQSRNNKPNFVIRIEKRYPAEIVARKRKNIVSFFSAEIQQFSELMRFLVHQQNR